MNKRGWLLIIVLLLIISSSVYLIFFKSKTCDTIGCFERAAADCERAKLWTVESGGTETFYKIKGGDNDNCELYIKILNVAELDPETTEDFEGKDMVCKIPLNKFSRMVFEEMGSDLEYCSGPLKEEMYEVLVKKLYKLVLDELGVVLEEVERVIGK